MLSPPKFNIKVLCRFRLCLEKGRIGIWRQMNEDMKWCGQKEHSKQGDKQNKFILITKHALIH